jgi:8-oxo-dGTP pyrophosphatase MutT (NUDIX family)
MIRSASIMPLTLFRHLFDLLPRVAEEGHVHEVLPTSAIDAALSREANCSTDEAAIFRLTVQRLLSVACLLDESALDRDEWRFVSFPAALFARSLIASLSEPRQTIFPPHYWDQGVHRPEQIVEEQRTLLRELEIRRTRYHPCQSALPIRTVHVAWGLIRLDGQFLLCHREDKNRSGLGNHVFPGGRANITDWSNTPETWLDISQDPGQRLPESVYKRALIRELEEEIGLIHPDHYRLLHWRHLAPWRQVEGARNNQAYTEYQIDLWQVRLHPSGEARLYEHLDKYTDTAWFGTADLIRQQRPDGKTAYLDALLADLGPACESSLAAMAESLPDERPNDENDAIDISHMPGTPFLYGKTGKEKQLELALTPPEQSLLFALAWHAKGLGFTKSISGLGGQMKSPNILPRGWVRLGGELAEVAAQLVERLGIIGQPLVEMRDGAHARLNRAPGCLYFNPALFRFDIRPDGQDENTQSWQFEIRAEGLDTPLGVIRPVRQAWPITRNTARILIAIQTGADPESDHRIKAGDIQKTLRDQIDRNVRAFGLRKLVRIEEGRYRIEVKRYSGSSPVPEAIA